MRIPPDKWERVKELLESALELTPEEIPAFLDEACSDPDVRHELERLLAYRSQVAEFLESRALQKSIPSTVTHLQAGILLDGRFRIVRFIARGGMGEVYEARDQELREKVAIKTVRQDLSCQPRFLETFRSEVHLAKQVTHPNVCRIYDFFRHTGADGETVFVSMEFLSGETLAERLKRTGRIATPEALPIMLQVAQALSAAHHAGILHRDLKPGNVILVQPSSKDRVRAVVTDFGLALQQPDEDGSTGPLSSLRGLGTPAYMSPEQIEGRDLTSSSDIYALGLIMHEMVTGKGPFDESTPLLAAAKRLYEPPIPPRDCVADIDRTLDKIILRCLERDPSSRPQTAEEVIETISSIGLTKASGSKSERGSGTWRWMAVASLIVLAGTGALYRFNSARVEKLTPRDTILVADFTNKTGDPVWDDTLKQGLRIDLEQSPYLNIISDERVSDTLRYMGQPAETRVTRAIAREVCQRVGSKAILLGSISDVGNNFVIGLEAVNCQTQDSLVNLQVEADSRKSVLTKLHTVGTEMRRRLGESLASIARFDTPVEQATTSSLAALQAYSAALKTKRSKGDTAALPLLKRAIDLDENFAMAYAVLGMAYSNLGEIALSSDSAKKAYSLRNRVTERERLYIESAYYNLTTGEMEKEIEVYEQWRQTYPQDEIPYQKSAYCNGFLGQYENAAALYRDALKLNPEDVLNYVDLASTYLSLDQLDHARAVLADLQNRKLQHEFVPQVFYLLAFLRDDADGMKKWTLPSSWMSTTQDMMLSTQADTEAFHGRIRNARELSRRAIEFANQNEAAGRATFRQARWALQEAEFGNVAQARRLATAALGPEPGEDVQLDATLALALARSGDIRRAGVLATRLNKQFPSDFWFKKYWLPSIRAAIEISRGNPAAALTELQVAEPYELGGDPIAWDNMYPIYLRGQAYLMLRQGKAASVEFQKILAHPGRIGNSPLGSLARLQLGRACALSGETAKGRIAYQEFLKLWKNADSDARLKPDAEIEYAKL